MPCARSATRLRVSPRIRQKSAISSRDSASLVSARIVLKGGSGGTRDDQISVEHDCLWVVGGVWWGCTAAGSGARHVANVRGRSRAKRCRAGSVSTLRADLVQWSSDRTRACARILACSLTPARRTRVFVPERGVGSSCSPALGRIEGSGYPRLTLMPSTRDGISSMRSLVVLLGCIAVFGCALREKSRDGQAH